MLRLSSFNSKEKWWEMYGIDEIIAALSESKSGEMCIAMIEIAEKALKCPGELDKLMLAFEEYSASPITKTLRNEYINAKLLYSELQKVCNNENRWFQVLMKCKNHYYIAEQIKIKLIQNKSRKWWVRSIDYYQAEIRKASENAKLKKYLINELLIIYHRYRRYFCTKKNMIKIVYTTKIKEKNQIKMENESKTKIYKEVDWSLKSTPFIGFLSQPTSVFPSCMIKHITRLATPRIILKLQQCSKYFYIKTPKVYCHRLLFLKSGTTQFYKNSLFLSQEDFDSNEWLKNYYIGNSLHCSKGILADELSALISTVSVWNLKYVDIQNCYLPENFELLLNDQIISGNFTNSLIPSTLQFTVESFINLFPQASSLLLPSNLIFTSFTDTYLANLQKPIKLKHFLLARIPINVEPEKLVEFVKNNAASASFFTFRTETNIENPFKSLDSIDGVKPIIHWYRPYY